MTSCRFARLSLLSPDEPPTATVNIPEKQSACTSRRRENTLAAAPVAFCSQAIDEIRMPERAWIVCPNSWASTASTTNGAFCWSAGKILYSGLA